MMMTIPNLSTDNFCSQKWWIKNLNQLQAIGSIQGCFLFWILQEQYNILSFEHYRPFICSYKKNVLESFHQLLVHCIIYAMEILLLC